MLHTRKLYSVSICSNKKKTLKHKKQQYEVIKKFTENFKISIMYIKQEKFDKKQIKSHPKNVLPIGQKITTKFLKLYNKVLCRR